MAKFRWKPVPQGVRALFWFTLGALFLYLTFYRIEFQIVIATLQRSRWGFITLTLVSVGINLIAKAIRWHILIGTTGKKIRFRYVLMALINGQILNWYLPARAGDVGRVLMVGNQGIGRTYTIGTIALEKILDLLSYSILFLYVTIFILPLPKWLSDTGFGLVMITILMITVIVGVSARPKLILRLFRGLLFWLPKNVFDWVIQFVRNGLESFAIISRKREASVIAILTAIIWLSAVATNHLTGLTINLALPISASLVVLLVLQAGISITSIPGKIGLFQYLCILSLGLFAVNHEGGLSYGILLQALVMLPVTFIGIIYNSWKGIKVSHINELRSTKN